MLGQSYKAAIYCRLSREDGNEESQLNITPLFNYIEAGETSERAELKFDVKVAENTLTLIPEKDKNIKIDFYASEGSFYDRKLIPTSMATPNYLIEENQFYMIDHRTGFLGVDNHYTPYDVQVKLKPFEKKKTVKNPIFANCDGGDILGSNWNCADRLYV